MLSEFLQNYTCYKGTIRRLQLPSSVIQYNDTLFGQQLAEKLFFLEYQLEKMR